MTHVGLYLKEHPINAPIVIPQARKGFERYQGHVDLSGMSRMHVQGGRSPSWKDLKSVVGKF